MKTKLCFTVADSLHNKFRKVIPEEQHESVTQTYRKETPRGSNTINVTTVFTDYCDKCSLHGLKYVGDLQLHPVER
jgi:hypothetical protein